MIHNCGQLDYHPFTFAPTLTVNVNDAWGNYTPEIPAQVGELYCIQPAPGGHGHTFSRFGDGRTL